MSAFRPSGGGGGIDPAQLAALVDDDEAGALLTSALTSLQDARLEVLGKVGFEGQATRNVDLATRLQVLDAITERGDALSAQLGSVQFELLTEILGLVTSRTQEVMNLGNSNRSILETRIAAAGLPAGFVAEFPANGVPTGFEPVQGNPTELPTGFGTAAISRTTGSGTTHRGFARTLGTSRIWSLYGTTLAALDLTLNKYDAQTFTLPVTPSAGFRSAVLHDLTDSRALVTIGSTNGTLGDNRAYTFDAVGKTFTQVANFQLTGTDGALRSGCGGTTLRLADGRIFWLPSETWRINANSLHANLGAANGGFYFLYDPVTNVVTSNRFNNWAAALASGDIGESGSSMSGLHSSLPIGQLPDGRLLLQELAATIGSSRYFILDLAANTITQGTGAWTGGQWALASHPQGLVAFQVGSTARRYFNAATNAMDAANATTYSTATVTGASTGFGYKALPIGNGNYAMPVNTGSSDTMALAFDTYARLGTVKARKVA